MRILLIEDDEVLADLLLQALIAQYYVVDRATDGQMGWKYAQGADYDLILMDVGLPKLDGITLCDRLRASGCSAPILLITAKDANCDRIRGLDAGADDYLIKPLDLAELQARVRALLRRREAARTPILAVAGLQLDPTCCQVTYQNQLLPLTPKEYSLIELFLRYPERVFSRGNIIEHLWTYDDPPQEESVKSHIKGLRQKLKAAGAIDWIENVYGLGYRLNPKLRNAPEPSSLEQQFNQKQERLWQQYRGLMEQRLEVLQQAAIALQQNTLTLELQQSATQAAHKLAGVLGMFARVEEGEMARELETLLASQTPLKSSQKRQARSLIQRLRDSLNWTIAPAVGEAATLQPPPPTLAQQAVKLLVVDDDPIFLASLPTILEPWGMSLAVLDNPLQFWDVLPSINPDLLILDVEMPQMSGIELCQSIRAHSEWQALPVLFLTAHREPDIIQQLFAIGADDYISKPIVGAELLARIANRLERIRLLQLLSTKDPITGLANQLQSSRHIEQLLQRAQTTQQPLCFILVAIAQWSKINRQYSHAAGNQVLHQWGSLLQKAFEGDEMWGYWGNGEFAIAKLGINQTDAIALCNDLLVTLRQQIFTTSDGTRFQVMCNFSIAEYPQQGLNLQSLYQVASTTLDLE